MPRVLITAFEPYDCWPTNASWLALVELTRDLPAVPEVTTRLYPVDFAAVHKKLEEDLTADFDYAIHLGQAPGSAAVRLEATGLNVGQRADETLESWPLVPSGPAAYRTDLPLAEWTADLRQAGIPAQVSHFAGTYLCNATLYWSRHHCQTRGFRTKSLFLHLPLDVSQTVLAGRETASLPASLSAAAIRLLLGKMAGSFPA